MDNRWAGKPGIEVDAPLCDRVCTVAFDAAVAALEATGALFPFGVVLDQAGEVRLSVPPGKPDDGLVQALLARVPGLVVGGAVDLVEVHTSVGRKDAIRVSLRRAGRPARIVYGFLESHDSGFEVGHKWTESELADTDDA